MRIIFKCIFLSSLYLSLSIPALAANFVRTEGSHFTIHNKPYYYVGTNFWYGAILASKGIGGNRQRLIKELDVLKKAGITNLRILVGGDGPDNVKTRIEPTLQKAPGIYNDTILDGLDYLLYEMGKRKMYAVLYLNNSWEWSGGYSQYLYWAGYGDFPLLNIDGWNVFRKYVEQYAGCDKCHEMYSNHVKYILTRINRYNKKRYTDDSAIMAWEVANEPRAFSEEAKLQFANWVYKVARLIKSIDKNHLLTIGSEGEKGCEGDIELWKKLHEDDNVDYTTIHIWPYNWSWVEKTDLKRSYENAVDNTRDYILRHEKVSKEINKPMVVEEFGFPRDSLKLEPLTGTKIRDEYYNAVFNMLIESKHNNSNFAGCNFWGWGGFGEPKHIYWQRNDDYLGDPAQEEQGLNSVFITDKTISVIQNAAKILRNKSCR